MSAIILDLYTFHGIGKRSVIHWQPYCISVKSEIDHVLIEFLFCSRSEDKVEYVYGQMLQTGKVLGARAERLGQWVQQLAK